MTKFKVTMRGDVYVTVEVEAETEFEAIRKAEEDELFTVTAEQWFANLGNVTVENVEEERPSCPWAVAQAWRRG